MRITVWGINYAPEVTGIAPFNRGLCNYLHSAGHSVRMVTAFPYYPSWRKSPADSGQIYRTDIEAEIPVHRCWQFVPTRLTALTRILHEFSFAVSSTLRMLALPRADVYVVVSPPLTLGPCAWFVSRIKSSRYVFHVQDLQPDAAVGLGMLKPGRFTRVLYRLEAWAYGGAAAVSGISAGMLAAFARKGVPEAKRWYFPNWIDGGSALGTTEAANGFRAQHGIAADSLLAVYSGNIGRKQGLEILIEAAVALNACGKAHSGSRSVVILIVGDGAAKASISDAVATSGVSGLRMLPLLSSADYIAVLAAMDVALITQTAGTGQYFFPSKLLSVLAAGRPVVTVADESSELAQAVAAGGFGRNVLPGQAAELASTLSELASDRGQLSQLAVQTSWVRQFLRERVLADYNRRLEEITLPKNSCAP